MDVAAWLAGLGLERYEQAFLDNEIDEDALPKLTAEDLKDLGVVLGSHRRRLLDAIAVLGAAVPARTATPATRDAPAPADAERRQLTVMFCDLVGSTPLAARLDPEDLREVIAAYHRAVAEIVAGFDGFVAKYMGDGVLVYFGYPRAHEDDAERAVRAGLGSIGAVGRLDVKSTKLEARVGIATGLVVVGDLIGEGSAQEQAVVGETPNLAARLQALATPASLVIAASTRQQIGELFDLEELGPQQLAGFAGPQRAWRVLGESAEVSRFEALRSGETPVVGREEEVELLVRRWQQAKSGEGRVVLISGEPGIGKSRLAVALSEHIGSEPHTRLRYFCSPHHQDSALYPFIAQLERAAGFARDDAVDARLAKLRGLLAPGTRDDGDIALLSELLSLPSSAADFNLSPQRKREKLFEAMLNQLAAEARHRPVLMVFEDAHWIDPTSRELLDLTVDRVRHLPVLLAITFRPEFQPPWGGRSHVTSLALNRLGERDGETLVQTLAGNAALAPDIVAKIVERTDGVPLFVEELTKAVLESTGRGDRVAAVLGTTSLAALSVPATLHASLMARLDRLGPAAKEVAQIGAVLGREFSYELIEPVAQRPERQLQSALEQLGDAGLLFCHGVAPGSSYLFKHALVQDAAYGTLLRRRRQETHGRVAAVLTDRFSDVVDRQPELVAHHLNAAGMAERAVPQWLKAGRHAIERSANLEAINHLRRGIEALMTLPDTPERARQELVMQTTLGSALSAGKGQGHPEFGQAYSRARELCRQVGETPQQLFPVLWGLWYFHLVGREMKTALGMAEQLLSLAQRADDPALLLAAHRSLGQNLTFLGEFADARAHLELGIAIYDARQHRALTALYGQDLGVLCRSWAGVALWMLGYPEKALEQSRAALALARELGHPYSLCYALNWAGMLHLYRREGHAMRERTETTSVIAREQGFAMWEASEPIWRGWALAGQGQPEDGIAQMRQGLALWLATGADVFRPYYLGLLAEVCGKAGQAAEALHLAAEALAAARDTGERFYEAELVRLSGEFMLQDSGPDPSQAERDFHQALEIARHQQAKSLELRAATSLARLWQQRGKRVQARDLLAPVYGWFTEGFDTADLKEAKALLDELT